MAGEAEISQCMGKAFYTWPIVENPGLASKQFSLDSTDRSPFEPNTQASCAFAKRSLTAFEDLANGPTN